jgi:hypothetical protein
MSTQPDNAPPPGQDSKFLAALRFIGWALVAIAGPISPWLVPLFEFDLISEYHRRKLIKVVSLIAFVSALVAFLWYRNHGKERLQRLFWWPWVAIFVGCTFLCLLFNHTVGETGDPGQFWGIVIWFVWVAAYFAIFISFTVGIWVLALIYLRRKETSG